MTNSPNSAEIIWRRRQRSRKAGRGPVSQIKRGGIALLAVFSLALFAGITAFSLYYAAITTNLPNTEILPQLLGERGALRQPTRLYDRTGEELLVTLENPNSREARYLFLELIPQSVIDATLAARDPDFWEHPGFQRGADRLSLAEQLVSELLLWQEPESAQKTWRTRFLAAQITETYGRETVLEWYLNNAAYGQLAFGVDEAAWVYFGKSAEDLNLAEAALLAATVDAPALNPIEASAVAGERQSKILSQMAALGYVSAEQALNANAQPILLLTTALPLEMTAPDFTRLALDSLYRELGQGRVERGGLEVITTLDVDLQAQTSCAISVQLGRLSGALPLDTLTDRTCQSAALLPRLNREELLPNLPAEAAAVIVDPLSGEVLALAGDVRAARQSGTVLSPFIYLTAFTRGLGPASLVWDIPGSLPLELDGYPNFDNQYHGPMRVRTAAVFDYVVPMLATLQQVGTANAWITAEQSGIHSLAGFAQDNAYGPVLEDGRVSLLEVTQAYSMFANQGNLIGAQRPAAENQNGEAGQIQPLTVLQVRDQSGLTGPVQTPETRPVTTPQLAFLVNDILSDETARRAALGSPNVFDIGRPVAAKQSRGLTAPSTWTIGYTPDRVIGVWVGLDQPLGPEQRLTAAAASGIWHALIKTASQGLEVRGWTEPVGIVHQVVCDSSGLLPTEDCPQTVSEVFVSGSEPHQQDNLFQSFIVNTQTGRLATIYTPEEFLEERVYMVVPPAAQAWAQAEGLPVPPDTYDVVFSAGPPSETANIQQPEIFSYVSGTVRVVGTAGGEDFDFYRVRIGEGLNPRQWLQIGEESSRPVTDGTLVSWDTTGLNGLYAVQLQVVAENQAIETASIQVTVDNQPPSIQVLSPQEDETFDYPSEADLTFQVRATDNLGLLRVEFWMDEHLISLITDPPYTVPWSGTRGEHQLEVRAIDLAGNISITVVPFEIE